jgi:hypothetical protein
MRIRGFEDATLDLDWPLKVLWLGEEHGTHGVSRSALARSAWFKIGR